MKKLTPIFLFTVITVFAACSGSTVYQGPWKAMDKQGNKLDVVFSPHSFLVKDSTGAVDSFKYNQNSVNIDNSVRTYGIQLKDGRHYQIKFPIANNESMGLVNDENGQPLFTICRDKYLSYDELYRLN
jgi:hypothetical protein